MRDSTREVSIAGPHLSPCSTATTLEHRANQAAWRAQYSRPSCARLSQAIRMAWQQPRRLAPGLPVGRKIRACVRPVVSCPRRSCTRGGPVAYPSFPASLPPSVPPPSPVQSSPRATGTNANTTQRNATQRNAAQRDPTTQPPHLIPTRPNPTQAVLSHPNPKLARLVPSDRKRQWPIFRPHSPGRLEPPGDPEIQLRQTQDRSRPRSSLQPPDSRLWAPDHHHT